MSQHPVFALVRGLVSQGELLVALEALRDFLSGQRTADGRPIHPQSLSAEVVVQFGQLALANAERRQGMSSSDAFQRTIARISSGVLELADQLERMPPSGQAPVRQSPITFPDPPPASLEKIIGKTSQLKRLAWLHQGLNSARSVCRVVSPRGLGTGFLTSDHTLMTNNHVLTSAADAAQAIIEFNYEEDILGSLKEVARYRLDPMSFRSSKELDCTIVKVRPDTETVGLEQWGALVVESEKAVAVRDHVVIVQHPQGGAKQICLTDNKIVNIYGHRVQYTTDTMPGSSGSPVFNDEWRVVAIHHAGGDLIRNARGDRLFANQGILMSAIAPKIREGGFVNE